MIVPEITSAMVVKALRVWRQWGHESDEEAMRKALEAALPELLGDRAECDETECDGPVRAYVARGWRDGGPVPQVKRLCASHGGGFPPARS